MCGLISDQPSFIFFTCGLVFFLWILVDTRRAWTLLSWKQFRISDGMLRFQKVGCALLSSLLLADIVCYLIHRWEPVGTLFFGCWGGFLIWLSLDTRRFLKLLSRDVGVFSDREVLIYRLVFIVFAVGNIPVVIERLLRELRG